MSDPVDAVVTWVDGGDPDHAAKRRAALMKPPSGDMALIPAGVDATRFTNNDEIELNLRSIRKFAPWVRTIHLVTDQQCPEFLTAKVRSDLGVDIVDHKEIFTGYDDVLPTFNSLSIETALYRIPRLSSRFIYFNDDFVLVAPVDESDFFQKDAVVLRGEWKRLKRYGPFRLEISRALNAVLKKAFGINRAMSVLQQIRGAELAGARHRYFKVVHAPYPIVKRTLEVFYQDQVEAFRQNVGYRFRSLNQYAVTALANHLEIFGDRARLRAPEDCLMICFNRDSQFQVSRKIERLKQPGLKFVCIQSLEEARSMDREELLRLLGKLISE